MKDSEKVELKQSKLSFKLTVKRDLEYKIRTLCSNIPNIEWSGILFYRPKGDIDEGTFEVDCVDVFLMDIGSSTFTEFETSPEIAAYIGDNLDLFDCQTGLIHSHNTMSTFFSGTDNKTLLEQGQENNHFLSLIVNNEGKYTAAITRQVVSEYTVNENRSYKSFGDKIFKRKNKSKGQRMFIEKINADIIVEGTYDFSERIKQIKDSKIKIVTSYYPPYNGHSDYPTYPYQRSIFDDPLDIDEGTAKKEYEKKEGWQHNFYQNYKTTSAPKSTSKSKKSQLEMYEDSFEYDIIMDIIGVEDPTKAYEEIEKIEDKYDESGISNQLFKEATMDTLNYYTASYNLDFKLMNDIVDLLPENRITSTLKSILADG